MKRVAYEAERRRRKAAAAPQPMPGPASRQQQGQQQQQQQQQPGPSLSAKELEAPVRHISLAWGVVLALKLVLQAPGMCNSEQ
jgi:hypothetical protein